MREFHVRIPDAHLAELRELGQRDDRDIAYLIRRAIKNYLQTEEIFARHDISLSGTPRILGVDQDP